MQNSLFLPLPLKDPMEAKDKRKNFQWSLVPFVTATCRSPLPSITGLRWSLLLLLPPSRSLLCTASELLSALKGTSCSSGAAPGPSAVLCGTEKLKLEK